MEYEQEIREIIGNILVAVVINKIELDTPLVNEGMDSIMYVKIILAIEKRFGIQFPVEKLTMTQCGTIREFCKTVLSVAGG